MAPMIPVFKLEFLENYGALDTKSLSRWKDLVEIGVGRGLL